MAITVSILALILSAYAVFRVQATAIWLSGSLETHSQTRLQLEAKEKGVRVIWWDKSHYGRPPREHEHNTTADMGDVIYLMVPLGMRAPNWWQIWRRRPCKAWIDGVIRWMRRWVDKWCRDESAV